MDDSSAVLSGSVLKLLTNPNYEKRKAAALELEKVIRESPPEKIKRVLQLLNDYVDSPVPQFRKGGLLGLASAAIGLDSHSFLFKLFEDGSYRPGESSQNSGAGETKISRGGLSAQYNFAPAKSPHAPSMGVIGGGHHDARDHVGGPGQQVTAGGASYCK